MAKHAAMCLFDQITMDFDIIAIMMSGILMNGYLSRLWKGIYKNIFGKKEDTCGIVYQIISTINQL